MTLLATFRNISCVAARGDYEFVHSSGDFVIGQRGEAELGHSEANCGCNVIYYQILNYQVKRHCPNLAVATTSTCPDCLPYQKQNDLITQKIEFKCFLA